jgi:hypothetical protein
MERVNTPETPEKCAPVTDGQAGSLELSTPKQMVYPSIVGNERAKGITGKEAKEKNGPHDRNVGHRLPPCIVRTVITPSL